MVRCVLLCVMGLLTTLPTLVSAAENLPVRVMSFNIRYGAAKDGDQAWQERKDFLVETIATFGPDLLGTQETLTFQRDYLLAKLSGYGVLAAGRMDGKEEGEMTALFYRTARFNKLDGGHFWLSRTPEQPGKKDWDAAAPRMATWVKLRDKVDPAGKPVLFINTHFDNRGEEARAASARVIRQQIDRLGKGCRLVVTGDFNAAEGSRPYQTMFGELHGQPSPLQDTFRTAHPTPGEHEGTFSRFDASRTQGKRIDWIACSRDWEVRLAGIDRTSRDGRTPSDHLPVTAVLRPAKPNQPQTLRVLCYNIHHGRGTDDEVDLLRIARIIRNADPDLVALQEVDMKTQRTGGVDQTAELSRLTGMEGRFGKAINYQGGEYGQAILSRYPLGEGKVYALPGAANQEIRIGFAMPLKIDGCKLTFITTHLHHRMPEVRLRQANKLNQLFTDDDQLKILAGDMNALPDSEPIAQLTQQWTMANPDPKLLSYPSAKPSKQIDYILYRPVDAFRVQKAAVLDEPVASDHRPVLAVLSWPMP